MTRPTRPRTPLLYHGAIDSAIGSAIGSASATWLLLLAVIAFYATALLTRPGLSQLVIAQCALGASAVLAAFFATASARRETGSSLRAPQALGLVAPRVRAVVGALLVGATTWYPNLCLALWVQAQLGGATRVPGLERLTAAPNFALTVACISLFPAICEELAFRGLWARALAVRFRIPLAVAITAPMFGLYHLSSAQLLPASLLGAVLAWSSLRSGSLWISIVIHAVNNATALLASRGRLGLFGEALDAAPHVSIAVALAIAAMGLALIAAPAPASPDERSSART